MKSLFIRRSF